MSHRALAIALLIAASSPLRAQHAVGELFPVDANGNAHQPQKAEPVNAWVDLRQNRAEATTVQRSPSWVEAVTVVPPNPNSLDEPKTIFRIRVARPQSEFQALLVRLFFDDVVYARPELVAWDESGSQILRSGPLGSGVNLPLSDTMIVPTLGASAIDIEVPGDGTTVRGVYLDWMTSSEVAHPVSVEHRDMVREPFALIPTLRTTEADKEQFGSVTATLAAETIRLGRTFEEGAGFQFGLEAQPLMALLTFEVANPQVEAPPQIYINGQDIGAVTLVLPDLADPGYRGEMQPLASQMLFHYTGWVRAQKMVPAALLQTGTNDLIVASGNGEVSAIRSTQIELKYLWEKSDYLLKPRR